MGYVDRALTFSNEHPEAGFPFVVYSTRVQVLITMGQLDDAERFAKTAIAAARAGDRRIKEIELSMMLAQIAEKRGQEDQRRAHHGERAQSRRSGSTGRRNERSLYGLLRSGRRSCQEPDESLSSDRTCQRPSARRRVTAGWRHRCERWRDRRRIADHLTTSGPVDQGEFSCRAEAILDSLWEAEQHLTLDRTPSRFAARVAREGQSLESLQQRLGPGEMLVEYVLGEPQSYALTVTRAGGNLVVLPSKKNIETLATPVYYRAEGRNVRSDIQSK